MQEEGTTECTGIWWPPPHTQSLVLTLNSGIAMPQARYQGWADPELRPNVESDSPKACSGWGIGVWALGLQGCRRGGDSVLKQEVRLCLTWRDSERAELRVVCVLD